MSALCYNTSVKLMLYNYHIFCDLTDVLILTIVCTLI